MFLIFKTKKKSLHHLAFLQEKEVISLQERPLSPPACLLSKKMERKDVRICFEPLLSKTKQSVIS